MTYNRAQPKIEIDVKWVYTVGQSVLNPIFKPMKRKNNQ